MKTPVRLTSAQMGILNQRDSRPQSRVNFRIREWRSTRQNTALVVTDPQNDFLSPDGVTWGVVGKSVTENDTVENIDNLFKAAKANEDCRNRYRLPVR